MPQHFEQHDFQKIPILGLVGESSASAPASPVEGQFWYDSANKKQMQYQNGVWVKFGSSTAPSASDFATNLKAQSNISGGGWVTWDASAYLRWSTRFIVVSNGNGSHFSTAGYFDIAQPPAGTVVSGVGGAISQTVTVDGIPIPDWYALYYVLPIGSGASSVAANFRLAHYVSAFVVPDHWVLVAVRNSDMDSVRLCDGRIIKRGSSSAHADPYTMYMNAARGDARYLGVSPMLSGDLNSATQNGYYYAINTTTNTPVAGGCFNVHVVSWSAANYVTQFASEVNTKALYYRQQTNGTWGAWSQIQTQATADARYGARFFKEGLNDTSGSEYVEIGRLPIDDAGNYSSMIIEGRAGGWVGANMAYWQIMLTNRSDYTGNNIGASVIVSGAGAAAEAVTDIVVYKQADLSAIVYAKLSSYSHYAFDMTVKMLQATYTYTGSTVTPVGTLIWSMSTAPALSVDQSGNMDVSGQIKENSQRVYSPNNKPPQDDVIFTARVASTGNLTLSGTQTIDYVAVGVGDIVVAAGQTASQDNGVYVVAAGAWTRHSEFNTSAELATRIIKVKEGLAWRGSLWETTMLSTDTLGTTGFAINRLLATNRVGYDYVGISGTYANKAHLGSGTADSAKTLRGDQTWKPSQYMALRNVGASGSLTAADELVCAYGTGVTLTLPDPATLVYGQYITIKITGAFNITVASHSGSIIEGAASITLTPGQTIRLVGATASWLKLGAAS
jgi:hypothetical protein